MKQISDKDLMAIANFGGLPFEKLKYAIELIDQLRGFELRFEAVCIVCNKKHKLDENGRFECVPVSQQRILCTYHMCTEEATFGPVEATRCQKHALSNMRRNSW